MTKKQIEFYFEYASPYAYFASHWVDDLAKKHAAEVVWKPFLLGAVFKEEGTRPLVDYPKKGAYSLHDMKRTARLMDVPFTMPSPFPFMAVAAGRAFYALVDDQPEVAKSLAKAIFAKTFGEGVPVGTADLVLEIATSIGIDVASLAEKMQSADVKDRLRDETQTAISEKGVFGAPFFVIDGEPFWGNDRQATMDAWLEKGGW
ncbi:MAG: 2-hydroxychromene-2-carboxylate isomerase [Alphaproteobacteria bacterium]